MDRFPIVIVGGAALLGWIAGDMIAHDVALKAYATAWLPGRWVYAAPVAGALFVVLAGKLIAARRPAPPAAAGPVDLVRHEGE
jgi:predicted tellurium resistance membrane protein TerC